MSTGVVLAMLFLGMVEDGYFRWFFFLDGKLDPSLPYLVAHLLWLLSFLLSLTVVVWQTLDTLPAIHMYWKKLGHHTRTRFIFGGEILAIVIFVLLVRKLFGL